MTAQVHATSKKLFLKVPQLIKLNLKYCYKGRYTLQF